MGKRKEVHPVLEERLLIGNEDRELLIAMEELSPSNTGTFLMTPSVFEDYIPTLNDISKKTGMDKEEVWERMNNISKVWGMPEADQLPTNNGFFDKEDALVNALVNQHKLRKDDAIGDYRVTKMHMFSGEMGTGTLYTNEDAFRGEELVRQAMGIDKKLASYHMQGGVMPEMIQMFGKLKNKRAIMTGLNRTGKEADEDEVDLMKKEIELLDEALERDTPLTDKMIYRLTNHVANTIDSLEEAAESSAYQLLPLVKNVEDFSQIHIYYSYNDDANKSEIEDKHIALLRKIHNRMGAAARDLPQLRRKRENLLEEKVKANIGATLSNNLHDYLTTIRDGFESLETEEEIENPFKDKGEAFRDYMKDYFETPDSEQLKNKLAAESFRDSSMSAEEFSDYYERFTANYLDDVRTMNQLEKERGKTNKKFEKIESNIKSTQDKINEARNFEHSQLVEQMEGHSWFTKKIAIKPTEAKMLETINKEIYKEMYTEVLIPKLKELANKDLDIKVHTDDVITVEVPDPQYLINGDNDPNRPIGTLMTSLARTNAQNSNEPLTETLRPLQAFHEGQTSEAIKAGKNRPEKFKDFKKRDFANSDIYFTSYGADGYKNQMKFSRDPSTKPGEYVGNDHIAAYLKIPTRHDTHVIGELMAKGNKGTWPGKRIVKGGNTTGPVLYIEHPDRSTEQFFLDDDYLANIGREFGPKINEIDSQIEKFESKLNKARKPETAKKYKQEIKKFNKQKSELLEQLKPQPNTVLLQNDVHVGAFSTPGRTNLVDGVLSSQLVAIQSYGMNGIDAVVTSEIMNGEQAWRTYDSSREGFVLSPTQHFRQLKTLEGKLRENGASTKDILKMTQALSREYQYSIPAPKPEEQKQEVMMLIAPSNIEMLENGIPNYLLAGNHWMSSGNGKAEDEANVLSTLFGQKYHEQDLVRKGQSCSGQGFTYELFGLPGTNGDINFTTSHKFWSGATEISQMAKQVNRTREQSTYILGADRHHPGAFAELGKMGALDIGKQPTITYRKQIGKSASIRGHMAVGYDPTGANGFISTRYFVDNTIEPVCGWEEQKGLLIRAHSLIDEGIKDNSIFREKKKIDYYLDRNKGKDLDSLMDKYSRK